MTIDELVLDPEQKNYWDFEVLPNVNFKNCNRIHPLKQLELQKLIDASAYDKGIDAIVVFGSATQFRCNSKSDIDMVIFRNDNKKYYPDAKCSLDFTTPFEMVVAVMLSAQCTDKRINMITPALFKAYPTAEAFQNTCGEYYQMLKKHHYDNKD